MLRQTGLKEMSCCLLTHEKCARLCPLYLEECSTRRNSFQCDLRESTQFDFYGCESKGVSVKRRNSAPAPRLGTGHKISRFTTSSKPRLTTSNTKEQQTRIKTLILGYSDALSDIVLQILQLSRCYLQKKMRPF